ncbi:hypothetical protein BISU_3000 [Bifidobacterium subtile]|jgi:hypothetical protein|uniref:Uncharacterized protein n=1 Tax=Bifidobacterium subtile TaxID=77635 RepID=A0A087E751_9BIFI|nr:hypothetical protein BISU_3000 [Bifidobacterium subtile]
MPCSGGWLTGVSGSGWRLWVGGRASVGMGLRGFSCSVRSRFLRRLGGPVSYFARRVGLLRACRRVSVLCGFCPECGRVLLDVRMPEALMPPSDVRHAPRQHISILEYMASQYLGRCQSLLYPSVSANVTELS